MPDLTVSTTTFTPDGILAGEFPRAAETVMIVSGQNLASYSLLGRTLVGAAAVAVAAATNAATTGTIGAVTVGSGAKLGAYKLTCIEPAANSGKFSVEDPDGQFVGVATVAVAYAGPIGFTIADGTVDFLAGESFTITVTGGTWKYKLSLAAATDGSQHPMAVLIEEVDATSADALAGIWRTGEFDDSKVVYGTGHTAASVKDALALRNIYLRSTVRA